MNLEGVAPRSWLAGWYAVHTATQHVGVWSPENAPAIRTALEARTEDGLDLAQKIRAADRAMRAGDVRMRRMRWCPHGPDFLVRDERAE